MNAADLLQCAQQVTAGKQMSFGELLRFKFSARDMVVSKEDQRHLVDEVKRAFSSAGIDSRVYADEVLVIALCNQTLAEEDAQWLLVALVEQPEVSFRVGKERYGCDRDEAYRRLALHNGPAIQRSFAGRILDGEWVRACAATYIATRDNGVLVSLMMNLQWALSKREWDSPRRALACELLKKLGSAAAEDHVLKNSLLELLLSMCPGSEERRLVEEALVLAADSPHRQRDLTDISNEADSMSTSWIADESIEALLRSACTNAEQHVAEICNGSPSSHEERITGMFLCRLEDELKKAEPDLRRWSRQTIGGDFMMSCGHEDVAARGPEKRWGADLGILIDVEVEGRISFRRAVLAQAKKCDPRARCSWIVEPLQRDLIIEKSPLSIYLLYGGLQAGNGVTVVPATTMRDLMVGAKTRTRVSDAVLSAGRKFSDFFVRDFFGDWWGDSEGPAYELLMKGARDFAVRWIFSVSIKASTTRLRK